jgi:hypothetical protein
MTVQNSVSRTDETLTSLLATKTQNLAVLTIAHVLREEDKAVSEVALLPAGQLDYAVDNMIRLHLLGTVPVEMREKFVEQVQIMEGQCAQIRSQVLQSLSDEERAQFIEKLDGFSVPDDLAFAGASDQLKRDFQLNLVHDATEVRLVPVT